MLFVEGQSHSLDAPLYALLFPDVSVIPKESCRDVMQATLGIRASAAFHRVQAFGLIDNDRRSAEELARFVSQGIFALTGYSVESIYYNPDVQRRVSLRQTAVTGHSSEQALEQAKQSALSTLAPHVRRLAERSVERTIRSEIERKVPTRAEIAAGQPITISVQTAQCVQIEVDLLNALLVSGNLTSVIQRYPVRETPALDEIARKLGFQGRGQYEAAVRKLLIDDPSALQIVRELFGALSGALSE
jgi:hypothetical protein